MSLSQLWTEIENEQSWRFDEIRFFQNRLAEIKSEEDREKYRKALVLILYSHFEGFCKFAFLHGAAADVVSCFPYQGRTGSAS